MSKSSWWDLTPPVRNERATPVPEDVKQPKMIRHEPKPFSVQVKDNWNPEWRAHKSFETLKKAEDWVKAMTSRLARRVGHRAQASVTYRVDPAHYPELPAEQPTEQAPAEEITLAMRAMFSLK